MLLLHIVGLLVAYMSIAVADASHSNITPAIPSNINVGVVYTLNVTVRDIHGNNEGGIIIFDQLHMSMTTLCPRI